MPLGAEQHAVPSERLCCFPGIYILSDSGFDAARRYSRDMDHPVKKGHEPEMQKAVRTNEYLRAAEDAVEQNDNSLDGIINNLPEEATGSVSGLVDRIRRMRRNQSSKKSADRACHSVSGQSGSEDPRKRGADAVMQRKDERFEIRISAKDKQLIRQKPGEAGITNMSAYVRKMATSLLYSSGIFIMISVT